MRDRRSKYYYYYYVFKGLGRDKWEDSYAELTQVPVD